MSDVLKVVRLHLVLVGIFAVGRWAQGLGGLAYERNHQVFSLVILTFFSAAFTASFCRRWRGYGLGRALVLGLVMGLITQVVIFLSTAASYALDVQSYFNHPRALNAEAPLTFAQAMVVRAQGLLVGPLLVAVLAAIGWSIGGLLPAPPAAAAGPGPAASPPTP